MQEHLQIRIHGDDSLPTLIYLPGLHGDWTLISALRSQLAGKVRFVEFTYPRSLEWTVPDYSAAISKALNEHEIRSGWLLGESFGSQPSWGLVDMNQRGNESFRVEGVILAGGFVKHPWQWGPGTFRKIGRMTPAGVFKL